MADSLTWEQLRDQADSLSEAGQPDSCLTLATAAVGAYRHQMTEEDTTFAGLLYNQGNAYANLQQFTEADSLWQIALDMRSQWLPDQHPAMMENIRWLGYLGLVRGDYGRAEPFMRRSIAAWEGGSKEDTLYVLRPYLQLGVLCMNQGRIDDAETAYAAGLEIIAVDPVRNAVMAANFRNNLSNLYRAQDRPEDAQQILEAQIDGLEAQTEPDQTLLLAAYHNLAEVYVDLGLYDTAEVWFLKVVERNQEFHGDGNYSVAFNMTSLGKLYMNMGRYEEASAQFSEALRIKREGSGLADRSVANTLIMYSLCEYTLGNLPQALDLARESFEIRHSNFVRNYWVLSEDRALTYSHQMRSAANGFLLPVLDSSGWSDEIYREAADVVISAKGQVSDGVFQRQQQLVADDDPLVIDMLEQYQVALQSVSRLYASGPGREGPEAFRQNLDSLSRFVSDLEGALALESTRFRDLAAGRQANFASVQAALPAGGILIEYMKYRASDIADDVGEDHYLVMVVRKQGPPVLISLGPADQIDTVVAVTRYVFREMARSWPAIDDSLVSRSDALHERLYENLILPVEHLLAGSEMILIAPDAALNLVSFGALRPQGKPFLIERFPVHYLSASRDLVRLESEFTPAAGLLLLGDIDYDATATDRLQQVDATEALADARSTGQFERLLPLPYTGREVRQLSAIWNEDHTTAATILSGAEATEGRFKKTSSGNRVIHCATHGFFDSSQETVEQAAGNPLLRSGLYLAGANLTRAGQAPEADDGFLTAWEVAALDLHGTEWVVLSACESGLGHVQTGEGVYGLRRAFQMAGVRTVISSLWAVPDKRTAGIMKELYASREPNLAHRMQQICLTRIEKARAQNQSDNPFSWAAFIAVGDWRVR
jgi:CHAT domain-containing protein